MNRRTFGYRYVISNSDFQQLQDCSELAFKEIALDALIKGIREDLTLPANQRELAIVPNAPTPDLTLDLNPGSARDYYGQSIKVNSLTDLNISQDINAQSTAVTTSGNELWVTVFIEYAVKNTDQRFDKHGDQYFYVQEDFFSIKVLKSAEFSSGLTLAAKKLLRPPKPNPNPGWIFLGDVLKTFGMAAINESDIYRDRKESIVAGNAKTLGFDNDSGKYAAGVDNVDEALEEAILRIENVEDFAANLTELYNRNFSLNANNLSLFFDKTQGRLYSSTKDILNPSDTSVCHDGTYLFSAIQHKIDSTTSKIFVRVFNETTTAYSNEIIVDDGYVYSPKCVAINGGFALVYLQRASVGGALELRYRRFSVAIVLGDIVLTQTYALDNVNNYSIYPVQGTIATSGINPLFDNYKKIFDVSYDSVNQKVGIMWMVGSALGFRNIDNSNVASSITPVPTTYVVNDGVSICFNGTLFLFAASATARILTNTIDNALTIGTEQNLITSGFTFVNLTFCDNDAGTDYGVLVGLNSSSFDVDIIRVISDNSAAPTLLGSFNAGADVDGISGAVWNPTIDNLSVFFLDSASGKLYYREISTGSVSGADTQITTSGDYYDFSNIVFKSGATKNYWFVGFELTATYPFDMHLTRLYFLDDQAGPINYQALRQGDGGFFAVGIKQNPKRIIRVQLVQENGAYVSLPNHGGFYVDVDAGEFVAAGYNVRHVTASYSLLDVLPIAYNKPIAIYRYDEVDDGIHFGFSSYIVPKNVVWSGIKSFLVEGQVSAANLAVNSITEEKIAPGAVTNSKLGTDAVTSGKIQNNAVTTGKLANYGVANGPAAINGSGQVEGQFLLKAPGLDARYIVCDSSFATADNIRIFNDLKVLVEYIEFNGPNYIGKVVVLPKPDGSKWTYNGVSVGKMDFLFTTDTAQSGATSSITLSANAIGDTYGGTAGNKDGEFIGRTIRIVSGVGSGQKKKVTAYDSGTKVATVDSAWGTVPDLTSVYEIGIDWSGMEVIFHEKAVYKGTIRFMSDYDDVMSTDKILTGNAYTYNSGTRTFTRATGTTNHIISLTRYPYIQIESEWYKVTTITATTFILDTTTPYYGTASGVMIFGQSTKPFSNVKLSVNIDNENLDLMGLDVRNCKMKLAGSLSNLALTKESLINVRDELYNIYAVAGCVFIRSVVSGPSFSFYNISNLSIYNWGSFFSQSGGFFYGNFSYCELGTLNNGTSDASVGFRATRSRVRVDEISNMYGTAATCDGAGFLSYYSDTKVNKIKNCYTTGSGGGFCSGSYPNKIEVGDIMNCAAADGGGFYAEGGDIKVGTIQYCTATTNGGAVNLASGGPFINVSAIAYCSASAAGGGVYVASSAAASGYVGEIASCSVTASGSGGGIFFSATSYSSLKVLRIVSCTATGGSGGGAFLNSNSQSTLECGMIFSCSATTGGGAYVYDKSSLKYGLILSCSSTDKGAGVTLRGGTIEGGDIVSCSSSVSGGGVWFTTGNSTARMGNILSCSATTSGGGLFIDSGTAVITFGYGASNSGGGTLFLNNIGAGSVVIGTLASGQSTNISTNTHFKTGV